MTLLYMDGFDLSDTLMRWAAATVGGNTNDIVFTTSPRLGTGKCVTINPVTGNSSTLSLLRAFTPSAQVYIGAAIQAGLEYDTNSQNMTGNLFGLYTDSGASGQLYLRRMNTNAINLYRGDPTNGIYGTPSGTLIASSAAGVLDGNWRYVEIAATIHPTSGSVTVRVDGTTVLTFSGNTKNTGTSNNIDAVKFRTGRYLSNPNCIISVDDLYICDGLGTVNNAFLGDVRIQSMLPNAAGSSTQLTPTGSANNYANAGEAPYNDATYNASATVGQRDTYALADLVAGTGGIKAVQSVAHMQKSDSGTANAKIALKSGASVYYDTTVTLATTSTVYTQVRETDPATSAAWTVAAANALEAGMEVA